MRLIVLYRIGCTTPMCTRKSPIARSKEEAVQAAEQTGWTFDHFEAYCPKCSRMADKVVSMGHGSSVRRFL